MYSMKKFLFVVTAVIEAGAGLALMTWPSAAVMLLLGSSLDTSAGLILGRVAGTALLALGVACWLTRHDAESRPAAGLIIAMLLYNSAIVLFLAVANIVSGVAGIALWPAVALHAAMAVWCIAHIRSTYI
jgi:hypothetical protein